MKQYMMIFLGGVSYEEFIPEEVQARMGKWFAWDEKMRSQGIVIAGEALTPQIQRISGEKRVVSDGPFVESKEIIGGFYVIKAESFEAVQQVAQDFPDYDLGASVEIREVMVFE